MLDALGLEAWLKSSGGKGLHVVAPLAPRCDDDTVKGFSQAIVQHLAKTIPARGVTKSGPSNRVGKLFVDYLRSSHGRRRSRPFQRERGQTWACRSRSPDDLETLKRLAMEHPDRPPAPVIPDHGSLGRLA